MFNTLYRCPRTIARHENGPLAESRRRYLEHMASQGAARPHDQGRCRCHLSRHNDDGAGRVQPSGAKRMSSERQNDGLIVGIGMQVAAGRT